LPKHATAKGTIGTEKKNQKKDEHTHIRFLQFGISRRKKRIAQTQKPFSLAK
jgi:hypothetical protein